MAVIVLRGVGATLTEGDIVFDRPALIAITFHNDLDAAGHLLDRGHIILQRRERPGIQIGFIVIEINFFNFIQRGPSGPMVSLVWTASTVWVDWVT